MNINVPETKESLIYHIGQSGTVVSKDLEWLPINEDTPLNCKMQLHTVGGVAAYGALTKENKAFFNGWFPLPVKPDWMKSLMYPER